MGLKCLGSLGLVQSKAQSIMILLGFSVLTFHVSGKWGYHVSCGWCAVLVDVK